MTMSEIDQSLCRELVGYARRLLGGDHAAAEDVVQDALLTTHRVLLDEPGRPIEVRSWLFRLVHNAAVDELRSTRRRRAAWCPPPDRPAPDAFSVLSERDAVREALGRVAALPRSQHQALVLHAVHGLDHHVVGASLGISRGASRALVHRARRGLHAVQLSH